MEETKTPDVELSEPEESASALPEAGQDSSRGIPKGFLWGGAIVALLVVFTLACLCLLGFFVLQSRSILPEVVTLLEPDAMLAPAEVGVVQMPPAALLKEDETGEEAEFQALMQAPMLQPEIGAEAQPMLGMRSAPVAPPTIEYFWADPSYVNPGQCSTLRWGAVLGATWAGIEPGVGGIGTPGDRVVCPGGTTTYILTAKGSGGQSFASATISVGAGPNRGTVVLQSEGPLDGYRSNDRRGSTRHDILAANAEMNPSVGEVVWRGFMSFDLSAIPRRSSIRSAELRFFQVRVGGEPYRKLGRLVLEHVAYGDRLEDDAYYVAPMDSLVLAPQTERKSWYVVASPKVREWIAQDRSAGRTRFQVRVRWERETDGDGQEDWSSIESPENFFGTGNAPKLTVTYGP